MARTDPSSPGYADFHQAVYNDPRVTDLDTAARYQADYSTDGGRTWQAESLPSVCGGHVQAMAASALLDDHEVTADGPVRTITEPSGQITRWTPTH